MLRFYFPPKSLFQPVFAPAGPESPRPDFLGGLRDSKAEFSDWLEPGAPSHMELKELKALIALAPEEA